ncbi:hypothetical protein [Kitasatospora sp. NPDC097643]|uniref:hypothetical protein n=1 Tax=Kitasatospora sp. NPDC097643 TaxID=3157230 RepID=UPI0033250557
MPKPAALLAALTLAALTLGSAPAPSAAPPCTVGYFAPAPLAGPVPSLPGCPGTTASG